MVYIRVIISSDLLASENACSKFHDLVVAHKMFLWNSQICENAYPTIVLYHDAITPRAEKQSHCHYCAVVAVDIGKKCLNRLLLSLYGLSFG